MNYKITKKNEKISRVSVLAGLAACRVVIWTDSLLLLIVEEQPDPESLGHAVEYYTSNATKFAYRMKVCERISKDSLLIVEN